MFLLGPHFLFIEVFVRVYYYHYLYLSIFRFVDVVSRDDSSMS